MSKTGAAWPMANYLEAWKTFRRLGNEPAATAEHVLAQPGWPTGDGLRVLDIGCGDGRMIEAFLQRVPSAAKAILLDPEDWMLSEAARQVGEFRIGTEVVGQVGSADEEGVALAREIDVGLAIHVVYLLSHSRFKVFVQHWPPGVPLFVVLDAPNSVFGELWIQTAQDYAARSAGVHEYLAREANSGLAIRRTDFNTRVANPFNLQASVQNVMLSLLCYCDYAELSQEKRYKVERVIRRHADGDDIVCACTCYELLRSVGTQARASVY
jgi:SAM-dependent methyltransferase